MSKTDIAVVQSFASMPETPEQITECNKELTEGEIASLAVGPNVLDFGKISACSVNTAHLAVTNHLSQHILVGIGLICQAQESRCSSCHMSSGHGRCKDG